MDEKFLRQADRRLTGWEDPVARLREEESALLPPGEFLPVFEHFRMMPQPDRWVRRLLKSETADTKLKAIVRVGEAAGFGVVAECVEEQDILVRLKAVGFAQGFGVYRPHPIDSIAG